MNKFFCIGGNIFTSIFGRRTNNLEEDPFYSEANLKRLRKSIAQLNAGRGITHELIEN